MTMLSAPLIACLLIVLQPEGQGTLDSPAGEPSPATSAGDRLGSPESWRLRFEPALWYVAPRGDVTLPARVGPVSFNGSTFGPGSDLSVSDLDADDPGLGFLGRVVLERGRLGFALAGAMTSNSGDATASNAGRLGDAFFAPGDTLDSQFDFWTFEATASYAMLLGPAEGEPGDPSRLAYRLDLIAGLRVQHVDVSLDVTPGGGERPTELGLSASDEQTFAQPIAGARLRLDLFQDFTIEAGGSVGYFSWSGSQTSSSWDVLASLTWRPIPHVGLIFGYRFVGLSGDSGDGDGTFEFRGSAAGLFAGAVVEF